MAPASGKKKTAPSRVSSAAVRATPTGGRQSTSASSTRPPASTSSGYRRLSNGTNNSDKQAVVNDGHTSTRPPSARPVSSASSVPPLTRSTSSASNVTSSSEMASLNMSSTWGSSPLAPHNEDGAAVMESLRSKRTQTRVMLTQTDVAQLITLFDRLGGSKDRLKDRDNHVAYFLQMSAYAGTPTSEYSKYLEQFSSDPTIASDHITRNIYDTMGQFVLMQAFVRNCINLVHEGYQEIENDRTCIGRAPADLTEYDKQYNTTIEKLTALVGTARRKAADRKIVDEGIDVLQNHAIIVETRALAPHLFERKANNKAGNGNSGNTDGQSQKEVTFNSDGEKMKSTDEADNEDDDTVLGEKILDVLEALRMRSKEVATLKREVASCKRDSADAERGYEATKEEVKHLEQSVRAHKLAVGVKFTSYDSVTNVVDRVLEHATQLLDNADERDTGARAAADAFNAKMEFLRKENKATHVELQKLEVILARKRKCRRRVVSDATEDAIVGHLERRMPNDWEAVFGSLLCERGFSDEEAEKSVQHIAKNQRVSKLRRAHAALTFYRQVCGKRMDTWTLERVLREHMRYDLAEFVMEKVEEEHRKSTGRPHTGIPTHVEGGRKEAYLPF